MKKPVKKAKPPVETGIPDEKSRVRSFELFILFSLSFIFYVNTCFNEYALDDHLVVTKNTFTQQGISGIPDLVKHTSYYGFFKNDLEEAALRYRPLVMISYALECEFIKNKKLLLVLSHLVNVLLFAGTAGVIYLLFSGYFFSGRPLLPFLATLLFVIHPIHTEAVANIKGRDELMSLFFAMLSIWFLFRQMKDGKLMTYIQSVFFFLCGLFSKESTLAFLGVIPLSLYFFSGLNLSGIVKKTMPYALACVCFIIIRFSITGWSHTPSSDILNNPYLNATPAEKYATIIWCMGFYLRLLIFPHPLSYDYTYNQIPLVTFSNFGVLIALFIHVALLGIAVWGIRKKSIWSYGILFYFITLILVTNLVVNLGAFIGERLLYTPSLGFCLVTAWLMLKLSELLERHAWSVSGMLKKSFLAAILVMAGIKTISRNADWKNNFTLMTGDVKASPESMKANDACAVNLILASDEKGITEENRVELLKRAIYHDHKASEILPDFTDVYLNLGTSFSRLNEVDSAAYFWDIARKQKPGHAKFRELDPVLGTLYLKRALEKAVAKDMEGCIADMQKSVKYDSLNAEAWYNYGGALFSMQRLQEAKSVFAKTLSINPSHEQARQGFNSLQARGY